MPRYAIMSGSKMLAVTRGKSKKTVNNVLAKEYKKENRIRVLRYGPPKGAGSRKRSLKNRY